MIRELRKKFILVAMLSTVLVLTLLIGSILILNYHDILQNADELLEILAENEGTFPRISQGLEDRATLSDEETIPENEASLDGEEILENEASPDGEEIPENEAPLDGEEIPNGETFPDGEDAPERRIPPDGEKPPEKPDPDIGKPGRWSEETPYETRYFSVLLDDGQEVLDTETQNIAAVTSEEAEAYAKEIAASGKKKGFYNSYRYLVSEEDTGTRVIFVDCGRLLDNFREFFLVSVGVSALGVLLVFLLVFYFSRMVFYPVLESDQKQKTFITDASHELKTPLTIIDANTEVLEMMEGENEFTRSIRNQVKRLTNLTQQMVTLTRMDEGRKMGSMAEVPFGETVTELSDSFALVAKSKGKSLIQDIDEGVHVTGDEAFLTQLVSLLLDNAVKYSDEEGNIQVYLHKKGKKAILQITNTARDLQTGNLDILFERFYRTDASRNSETGGSGIGLSVAKAIVQAHKGTIHARSTDGKTIEFTVTL